MKPDPIVEVVTTGRAFTPLWNPWFAAIPWTDTEEVVSIDIVSGD